MTSTIDEICTRAEFGLNKIHQSLKNTAVLIEDDMDITMKNIDFQKEKANRIVAELSTKEMKTIEETIETLKLSEDQTRSINVAKKMNKGYEEEVDDLQPTLEVYHKKIYELENSLKVYEKELKTYSEDLDEKKNIINREVEKYLKRFGISVKLEDDLVILTVGNNRKFIQIVFKSVGKNKMVLEKCSEKEVMKNVKIEKNNSLSTVLQKILREWSKSN